MKEIDKSYFSSISKLVNTNDYNQACSQYYDNSVYVENIQDEGLQSIIRSKLSTEGFAVVQMNMDYDHDPNKIESWLKNLLGTPFIDKNPEKRAYAKVQAEENAKYYINSNLAQPIHTDEGHTTHYPRYAVLYCSKQAQFGGDSIVVQLNPLYKQLKKHFGSAIEQLFQKDSITVHNVYGQERKSVLIKLDDGHIGISYSPVLQKMWCSDQVFQQFDFITTYVHKPENQTRLKLREGQMLLLDNCRMLHGRTAFPKNDGRLLYRYWFGNNAL